MQVACHDMDSTKIALWNADYGGKKTNRVS
jgi:hypothetical protein